MRDDEPKDEDIYRAYLLAFTIARVGGESSRLVSNHATEQAAMAIGVEAGKTNEVVATKSAVLGSVRRLVGS